MKKWLFLAAIGLALIAAWSLAGRRLTPNTVAALERANAYREASGSSGIPQLLNLIELGESREIRSHEIMEICNPLSPYCLEYIQNNELSELVSTEEDLRFTTLYESLPHLSLSKEALLNGTTELLELIAAGRDVYLTQLITQGHINASTVANSLRMNRANLASANTMFERMVFIATISTDLTAANLSLHTKPEGFKELSQHLKALSKAETSYQRTFDGEVLFGKWTSGHDDYHHLIKLNHHLNLLNRNYQSYSATSKTTWEQFWSREHPIAGPTTVDYLINPTVSESPDVKDPPPFMEYLTMTRYLDALIAVVRTIHMEKFEKPHQQPAAVPLPLWSWTWQDDSTFCLEPEDIHPAMQDYAEPICASWFGSN